MQTNIKRCTSCVLSSEFPKIDFDNKDVCNYCRKAEESKNRELTILNSAREKVSKLLAKKNANGQYDAIVCYSGGKDSTYALQLAVEKYDLRVLAFTLDNGFISHVAWDNIRKVVDQLGVDHWVYRPSSTHYKAIARASAVSDVYRKNTLTRISAICNSCISIVNTTALKLALEKDIPYILAGFTLGQIPSNGIVYKNHYRFLAESREESLNKLRSAAGDFVDDYFCISDTLLDRVVEYPHNVNILCVEEITEDEIREKISALGWSSPKDVDGCSSNCMLNTFNNYVHEEVFGYNPYEMELSHLIREGLMTRDEALSKIKDRPEALIKPMMKTLSVRAEDIEHVKWMYEQNK